MSKTRSQTGNISIKKEEEEEEEEEEENRKPSPRLNGVALTTKSKITKSRPSKSNSSILPVSDIKVEQDTDIKSLLQPASNHSKRAIKPRISQEQINQLIDYVENHNMNVSEASRVAKMSKWSGCTYYNLYKNDPEKKIPLAQYKFMHPEKFHTQEQIKNLIKYITRDKISIKEASKKANMSWSSGNKYYNKYLKDPNQSIPIPRPHQKFTQDQKNEFIGYIVNDKMTISAASRKAKINVAGGARYYHKYFDNQNHDIATPSHINTFKHYTQEQIKGVISYIIDDKMSIAAASRKTNMSVPTVMNHYRQYLKDNNIELLIRTKNKPNTQGEINKFVGYIVDDKMSINAASKKAKMCYSTGYKHYHRYLNHHNLEAPTQRYTQDQKSEFIGYIVEDKMTIKAASKKANIHYQTAYKYYQEYLKNQKRGACT